MRVLDLTHSIKEKMPVYPGTEQPKLIPASNYEKDGFKETLLHMYSHTGTHVYPPAHLYPGRTTLDQLPVNQFIGKALVINCRMLKEGEFITMQHLNAYGEKLSKADFLLFNLGWDKYWNQKAYFGRYPCLDYTALKFIIDGNYKGIGFDVIGLDPISDNNLTRHKMLFAHKDIINPELFTALRSKQFKAT